MDGSLDQGVKERLRKLLRGRIWEHVCDDWIGGRVKCPGCFEGMCSHCRPDKFRI